MEQDYAVDYCFSDLSINHANSENSKRKNPQWTKDQIMQINWQRVGRLKFFSEDTDIGAGPLWAKGLMSLSATVGMVSLAGVILSSLAGLRFDIYGAIFVSSFAIMAGASWHLQMPGRAKNGLVLVIVATAILFFIY